MIKENSVKKVAVVLPALNEQKAASATIKDYARYFPEAFIILVDNGSKDLTVSRSLAAMNDINNDGCVLIEHRRGKLNAVKRAFNQYDAVVWVISDCDATYPARDLREIYDAMILKRFDHGVADRLSNQTYINKSNVKTSVNLFGNFLFTKITQLLAGNEHSDVLSGGRVLSNALIRSICFQSEGFEMETELNLQSHAIGAETVYFPIKYKKRPVGSETKLRAFRDGSKILMFMLKFSVINRAWLIFITLGFGFLFSGLILGGHLISIYQDFGSVPYSSTAVLVSLLTTVSIQLFACALIVKVQKNNVEALKKINFQNSKLRWNLLLNSSDGQKN